MKNLLAVQYRDLDNLEDFLGWNLGRLYPTDSKGMAERVGFEPTVGFPLHSLSRRALSTAQTPLRGFHNRNRRFARSPMQSDQLRLAASCEERLQHRRAFIAHDACGNLHPVVEARVIEHRRACSHSATLGIVASVHQTRYTSLNHPPRAHAARFYRDVQCRAGQPIID